ncbi:redoxin domain-containing protein [Rubinisphaera italica]|uniref:Thiol-disulfide oxidoreductase n=1 Tax=Rubinisphaera italica TaxID=2527969 RepID=A0A5C5XFL5_9PLAN|nr:redoxin domain-containing protein [Rubinisphaera italica]TWT61584.1 thiol-disulfide oxidoreductase [Rubinisphaera italica]
MNVRLCRNFFHILTLLTITAILHGSDVQADSIQDFSLPTHRGVNWSLREVPADHLVVVAFLGTECPLARLYGQRLEELQTEFRDHGVTVIGIDSNVQDSLTEITAFVARHHLTIPILKDTGNRVADQFEAERTPEVFLLDQNREIRYRGRIDDQYLVGLSRESEQRRDLAIAIEEVLKGEDVTVPKTKAIGCLIGRISRVEPQGDVTYCNQIAMIFNQHCVECHRAGEVAPFVLTSYEDILGWEETILEVIAENRMPPWFANPEHGKFANDCRLSDQEKSLLEIWVQNGMPEGDPAELPEPPEFVKGWRIPEPDQVIAMGDAEFTVPAQGVVDYQYFTVDPGWTEDKFVCATEARPDNIPVVHHIAVYVLPPGSDEKNAQGRYMLVGYVPGSLPQILDEGVAIPILAGSKLLFEMHYTPNGREQLDCSYIGLNFMKKQDVKKILGGGIAINTKFEIPPGADHHTVTAEYQSPRDQLLLQLTPHMHLRGKAFRFEAFYPNGSQEILLDVPRYDFNWQLNYNLAKPKLLPKGTRILCTAAYDNSKNNLVNPDPTVTVRWGDQSWNEMMIGYMSFIEP